MKNSIHCYLTILLLSSFSLAKAQPCLPFGITFTTQTAVDSFTVNNPGCTEIQGVLVIQSGSADPIQNLNGLSGITAVMGGVYIQQNTQLSNLSGLTALHTIQGGLYVHENTGLENFIGLDSLEVLNGNLVLSENVGLLNPDGLQGLTSINGSVLIDRNHQMANLYGLDNIIHIAGDLDIEYNIGLQHIDHLAYLLSIGGKLKFSTNNSVQQLSGLVNLTYIGGDFEVRGNMVLESLDGMENLTEIGGNFFFYTTRLKDVNGLSVLQSIGGNLTLWLNNKLVNLEGLLNLTQIGGELIIRGNNNLPALNGLDNIDPESITFLEITANAEIQFCEVQSVCTYLSNGGEANINNNANLLGCANIEQVNLACEAVEDSTLCLLQGITISRQGQLDSFAINYPGCVHVLGDVSIQSGSVNPISEVAGLNHIETIDGNLRITGNQHILQLAGFDSLYWVGSQLQILNNMNLHTISGFNNLQTVLASLSIELSVENVTISGFSQLERVEQSLNITGIIHVDNCGEFNLLRFIGVGLSLESCNSIDLNGFSNLDSIGHTLRLRYLKELQNVNDLESLTSIRLLIIETNDKIASLSGLHNISNDEITSINLRYNSSLSTCNYANICAYLESGKPATINNNAPGCNSKEDILSYCVTSSGEVIGMDGSRPEVIVFPNPASAYLNIIAPEDLQFKAGIYNIAGQILRTFEFTETAVISLHDLPSGMYFLVFEYEGGTVSRKVVIE